MGATARTSLIRDLPSETGGIPKISIEMPTKRDRDLFQTDNTLFSSPPPHRHRHTLLHLHATSTVAIVAATRGFPTG
eukprot:9005278-Pyramimonas_sp.AAC.1